MIKLLHIFCLILVAACPLTLSSQTGTQAEDIEESALVSPAPSMTLEAAQLAEPSQPLLTLASTPEPTMAPLPASPPPSASFDDNEYTNRSHLIWDIDFYTDWSWLWLIYTAGTSYLNHLRTKKLDELYEGTPKYRFYSALPTFNSSWMLRGAIDEDEEFLGIKPGKGMKTQTFGFKPRTSLGLIRIGSKLGWSGGKGSCFGIYGRFYFEHERHYMRLYHEDDYASYRSNAIKPGLGVRFTPQISEDSELMPYLELGTTWTKVINCRSPFGTDNNQFGSGLTYNFGLGGHYENEDDEDWVNVYLTLELPRYNYFNRDWSPDGGFFYPYANVRDRKWSLCLTVALGFNWF